MWYKGILVDGKVNVGFMFVSGLIGVWSMVTAEVRQAIGHVVGGWDVRLG
jgi:hypothetical protein